MPVLVAPDDPGRSPAQIRRLFAIAKAHGMEEDDMDALLTQYGVDDPKNLPRCDYDTLCDVVIPQMFPAEAPVRADREPAPIKGRIVDGDTGEVYEDMSEAELAEWGQWAVDDWRSA